MSVTADIQAGMRPLFDKAEQQRLWFYSRYQDLWFSPEALKRHQAEGRFRWGAVNWELRDPRERVAKLREEAKQLLRTADAFEAEIQR